jgi:sarcosine oxidase/L-pipecolate oxidase
MIIPYSDIHILFFITIFPTMSFLAPSSILIIGSGVFGLSTALSLSRRSQYSQTTITVLDRSTFPSSDGSSIDTSRIIRADYSSPAYAFLAARAQTQWRNTEPGELGTDGRYSESGLVLVADSGRQGEEYVKNSWRNVQIIMKQDGDLDGVNELPNGEAIKAAVGTGGSSGDWGYTNRRSGWADAEASMRWLRHTVQSTGRVTFLHGEAERLLKTGKKVQGAVLKDGRTIGADLVILATGAWTGKLVDLRGRATATGQVLAYLDLTAAEQARLEKMPVLLNMSTGLFIIPPKNQLLKVARHAYGYLNPITIPNPDNPEETITVSLPFTTYDDPTLQAPAEGLLACRQALRLMIPSLGSRPFSCSRICWYTDTPNGDFLITYHPDFTGLFLATGGSGHGFKFLSVIGDCIVDCVEGRCPVEFKEKWKWPAERAETVVTEDGSRGGRPGLILKEELKKGSRL